MVNTLNQTNFNPNEVLNSLYIRDHLDPKYNSQIIENKGGDLDELIAKIKIILYTRRGQVLGVPNLGMDLENYLFNKRININDIRNQFYTQISAFVPEAQNYDVKIDIRERMYTTHKELHINITINNVLVITRYLS